MAIGSQNLPRVAMSKMPRMILCQSPIVWSCDILCYPSFMDLLLVKCPVGAMHYRPEHHWGSALMHAMVHDQGQILSCLLIAGNTRICVHGWCMMWLEVRGHMTVSTYDSHVAGGHSTPCPQHIASWEVVCCCPLQFSLGSGQCSVLYFSATVTDTMVKLRNTLSEFNTSSESRTWSEFKTLSMF